MNDSTDQIAQLSPAAGRRRPQTKRRLAKAAERAVRRQVARRIRELRKKLGIKQRELGAHLGVKQACVAGYENGRIAPRLHEIPMICRTLKCDPNSLFQFTND